MKRRTMRRFFAVTLAGVLAAGTAISASAAVSYEAPSQGMEANENYVKASAYAASTVLTQILGLELTSSNGAGIYNSGGSSSSYGTDSSNLGIFGSDINDVPDTYLYNYFYNLYTTQSGGGDYSVDDYAAWTATPYVLRWDSNKQGPQGQASGSTTITIDGVTKTCNPAFYYEPDIIIGAESGYSTQLASYQETYNADYDPTIISAVSSSGTRSDGLGLEYNMFEMSANLVEIGAAVATVEAEDETGATTTRYEANGYETAYETAVAYDNFNRGLYYYAQSAFASGELTEIHYASSASYDSDSDTWAITQGTGRNAQYASGIGNDIYDLLEDSYVFSDGTVVELTTTTSSSDSNSGGGPGGNSGGGSSTTSAYYLTTDQMIEILTVTGEDGTEYGGVIVGTSQGEDNAYTELADAGISFLNNLPECVYGITMQTTENGMGIAFYLSYFYYDQNEALNPVSVIGYWIEHFYHVSDTDAMQTVITNMLSSADLNAAYTGSDELNIDEYDEAAIEELMAEGIVYYVTVEEPALEEAETDSSSTAYWSSLDLEVGIGASGTVTCGINGHSYEAVVTDPDCTNRGYTTYTCTVCGDSYVSDYTDATGHSYEAVVTEPTETEQGYTTYTCTVCGDSYVADFTDALGSDEDTSDEEIGDDDSSTGDDDSSTGDDDSSTGDDDSSTGDDDSSTGDDATGETDGDSSSDDTGSIGDGTTDGGSDSDASDDTSDTGSTDDSSAETGSTDDSSSSDDSGSTGTGTTDGTTSTDDGTTGSTGDSTLTNSGSTLAAQTITVKAKTTKKIKATKLAKKKVTFKIKASAQGKVTFAKKSGSKKLKISKKGKVTVKKGTYKKGKTLSMKVTVTAKATSSYKAATKTIKVKVKIK